MRPLQANRRLAFRGAIFDVDGVLVDSPHERAWRAALQELMEGAWSGIRDQTAWSPEAFTPQIYQGAVSGKPRMSGALAALEQFAIPAAEERVAAYAERKQAMVVQLIAAGKFTAFPDALRFIMAVKAAGIGIAAASSSKNAGMLLGRIRLDEFAAENGLEYGFLRPGLTLLDIFDADVSGREFARGKPDPEMFVAAACELGRPAQECFVIEDAAAGVQAAKAGGMAALGIARADDQELLADAHADLVVTTLDDVDLGALNEGRLAAAGQAAPRPRDQRRPNGTVRPMPDRDAADADGDEQPAQATIRIVLADDHPVVRRGLRLLLDDEADCEVVAEAGDVEEARRYVRGHHPAVLVLDLHMPGGSSLEAIPALRTEFPETHIVVFTMQQEPAYAREALLAGATGYVLKQAADVELVDAVRLASVGERYLNPRLGARIASEPPPGPPDNLSPREVDTLRLIALGHTNTQIAEKLFVSVRTVETHRARIQQKLLLSSRAELVRYALDRKLLDT